MFEINKTDEQWQEQLTEKQYQITRKQTTEPPFSGEYNDFFEDGIYQCICCENLLFYSEKKFRCSCGWPSFSEPADEKSVDYRPDNSLGRSRTEVICKKCAAHLGHVFDDGPAPTYKRFCINSAAIKFEKKS